MTGQLLRKFRMLLFENIWYNAYGSCHVNFNMEVSSWSKREHPKYSTFPPFKDLVVSTLGTGGMKLSRQYCMLYQENHPGNLAKEIASAFDAAKTKMRISHEVNDVNFIIVKVGRLLSTKWILFYRNG